MSFFVGLRKVHPVSEPFYEALCNQLQNLIMGGARSRCGMATNEP